MQIKAKIKVTLKNGMLVDEDGQIVLAEQRYNNVNFKDIQDAEDFCRMNDYNVWQ